MSGKSRILIACAVMALLACTAVYAISWVSAEGSVHTRTFNGQGQVTHLKIQNADGSKVNADCFYSDTVRCECQSGAPGYLAEGLARCEDGFCSWVELETSVLGGDVDCGN